jgi:DNA-binding XRE family transcriptional regulator
VSELSTVLAANFALIASAKRANRRARALAGDRTLPDLIADLVAARIAAGMTQHDVVRKLWTTKSTICRLESGVCTRPNLPASRWTARMRRPQAAPGLPGEGRLEECTLSGHRTYSSGSLGAGGARPQSIAFIR